MTDRRSIAIKFAAVPFLALSAWATAARAEATLNGDIGNYSAYMLTPERLRHHRYFLNLRQHTPITPRFSTLIEGRAWFDAAVYPHKEAPYGHLPPSVRRDEGDEAEFRNFYGDYLGNSTRVRLGLQVIDWIESLSPYASMILTPFDLRHGGFGPPGETIRPVTGLLFNRTAPLGSVEALVVPEPVGHRLPVGENAYGTVGPASDDDGPPKAKRGEVGARYLMYAGSLELTTLAYHGHERSPVITFPEMEVTHPQANTYALFTGYSKRAWVLRHSLLYQTHELEEFGRAGLGFDYVFSKHLKVYSEAFAERHRFEDPEVEPRDEGFMTLRLTNESFSNVLISTQSTCFTPRRACLHEPEIAVTSADVYKIALGAHLVRSYDERSPLEPLRDASQVYLSFKRAFDAGALLVPATRKTKRRS